MSSDGVKSSRSPNVTSSRVPNVKSSQAINTVKLPTEDATEVLTRTICKKRSASTAVVEKVAEVEVVVDLTVEKQIHTMTSLQEISLKLKQELETAVSEEGPPLKRTRAGTKEIQKCISEKKGDDLAQEIMEKLDEEEITYLVNVFQKSLKMLCAGGKM